MPITLVGFRQHGKTVYFSSLYIQLGEAARLWNPFCYHPSDESGLDKIRAAGETLRGGTLPDPAQHMFAESLTIRLMNLPIRYGGYDEAQLLLFDTSGENFKRSGLLKTNANYIARSNVLIWLVSATEVESLDLIGFKTSYDEAFQAARRPKLVVVLTKSDVFVDSPGFPVEASRLLTGQIDELELAKDPAKLANLSRALAQWLRGRKLDNFVSLVSSKDFSGVTFLAISSLGGSPTASKTITHVQPRGVMLPILVALEATLGKASPGGENRP